MQMLVDLSMVELMLELARVAQTYGQVKVEYKS